MKYCANAKLKGLRIAHRLSAQDMAVILDITTTYLSLIESMKKTPSVKIIRRAARYFNLPVEVFTIPPKLLTELSAILKDTSMVDVTVLYKLILQERLKES